VAPTPDKFKPGDLIPPGLPNPFHLIPIIPGSGNITNPVSGITDGAKETAKFLDALMNPNTWVRLGEVVVGVILIAVGVSAMTKANPVAKGTKAAAKATVL